MPREGDHTVRRAEHALRPTEARAHGAGLLLAEACLGVSNGLHSRAPAVLRLLLQEPSLKVLGCMPLFPWNQTLGPR